MSSLGRQEDPQSVPSSQPHPTGRLQVPVRDRVPKNKVGGSEKQQGLISGLYPQVTHVHTHAHAQMHTKNMISIKILIDDVEMNHSSLI